MLDDFMALKPDPWKQQIDESFGWQQDVVRVLFY